MKSFKKPLTYLVIVLMAMLTAVNYQMFVFPNSFAPAGLNGICTMIQHLTGISVGYMSLIINIPLAIWVYIKVSRTMAVRSMTYVGVSAVMLVIFNSMDMSAIAYYTENGTSTILGPLAAGIVYGALYSILVRTSSTSGGTDFIAAIIHKYRPEKSMFWIIFALNVFVAFLSFFVYDFKVEPVLMCIMYCFTSSILTDKMSKSGRAAVRFEIVTDYPNEISDAIIHKYRPEKSMFWIIFALNVFVAFLSFFVYDFKIEPVIMCIMYCFTSSMLTDKMSKSGRAAVRFEIITDYPKEISDAIIHKFHHSATLIPGRGMYRGKEVSVLICVVNKSQMARLADIVRMYPNTFAVMSSVNEVMGNFKKIDSHGNREKEILDHGDVEIT